MILQKSMSVALVLGGCGLGAAVAQTHYVKKPETVVRAVGVYEWTGELAKPGASRLIPVTLFIGGHLEDAGVYLARPVPMALESGTVFELDQSGVPKGLLDLAFARHLQSTEESSAAPYDDGWFGYGQYKALAAPKLTPPSTRKAHLSTATVESSKPDTAKPHLSDKTSGADSSTASNSGSSKSSGSGDPDRPTMRRRDGASSSDSKSSDSGSSTASTTAPASTTASTKSDSSTTASTKTDSTATASSDDPDRPTTKRRDSSGSSTASTSTTDSSASKPADDPDRPTMKKRTDSGSGSTTASTADDPDRPTMKRRDDSGSGTTASVNTPADDPDRPTMKKRSGSSDSNADSTASTGSTASTDSKTADDPDRPTMKRRDDSGNSSTASGGTPADDPDRPTLKKRTPAERKAAQNESASVTGVGSLNDDPNRPNLHRGKPTHAMSDDDLPKMKGLPVDLHQMVAVSDAANRPLHDFGREFENTEEHDNVLTKMRDLARAKLAAYVAVTTPAGAAKPAAKPAPRPVANTPAARAAARKAAAAVPPPVPLADEVLKGYTLSYGGSPTYAFSASSAAPDGSIRYVTVIAQSEPNDELRVALSNVTDSKHLDRTPRLRLVDVVDVEASNRASLLFEARAQQSRSFALYRVIGAQAEQVFSTGSTQ